MAKRYSDKLKDPRWQKKRLQVLQRDNFTCKYCQDDKTELHIHHLEYSGEPWDVDNSKLETVCKHCHSVIEKLKVDFMGFISHIITIVKYQSGDWAAIIITIKKVNGDKLSLMYNWTGTGGAEYAMWLPFDLLDKLVIKIRKKDAPDQNN